MATSTTITISEFKLQEALNGATIGWTSTGALSGALSYYVLNFKQYTQSQATYKYSGQVGKATYYFDENGLCYDGDSTHSLFLIKASIKETQGTDASRGDGSSAETIEVSTMQPRENFACYALLGIMNHISEPLLLDDGQITQISSMAFKIAQGMLAAAADARAATSTEPPSGEIEIDQNEVSSTTDKILYNLNENLSSIKGNISNMYDTMISINTKLGNGLDININGTPSVNVTNMLSEPVSVTGTVSVDNFPESGGETT